MEYEAFALGLAKAILTLRLDVFGINQAKLQYRYRRLIVKKGLRD